MYIRKKYGSDRLNSIPNRYYLQVIDVVALCLLLASNHVSLQNYLILT